MCRRTINKGERYYYTVGRGEDFFTSAICTVCGEVRAKFFQTMEPGDTYTDDSILDWVRDEICAECELRDTCEYSWWETPHCDIVRAWQNSA